MNNQIKLCDRSSWGLLEITGEDRLNYLHNQSTNNFNILTSGQGCETVFVTSTARTIDLATTYITEDSVLVIVSPNRSQYLLKWLDKFIFPFDKVAVKDVSEQYNLLTLIGTNSHIILEQIGVNDLKELPQYNHQLVTIENIPIIIGQGSDLALPGYNLIVPKVNSEIMRSLILKQNVLEIDQNQWEKLRILQGRPAPDKELTEDYNPLEAGLWQTISFDKGCYIGQETITRLNTYNGVKQKLWGIKFKATTTSLESLKSGTPVMIEDKKIGILTSITNTEEGKFGLAYIRTKAGGLGLSVIVEGIEGELVSLPYTNFSPLVKKTSNN